MNDHKFAFIICTNDNLLLEECLHYINHLIIPAEYEAELLTIPDAPCMTQGYNEAMQSSDAKYKIYLHQDVFILNRNILGDLLSIFTSDPQIGMVGMAGYEKVAADGIMWHTDRTGGVYMRKPQTPYPALSDYRYDIADGYEYVAQIDGFFMATSHDLPWDTDRLDGWDFYDAFQSIRFLLEGYKIAVPCQKHPWCMHDDDKMLNLSHYDHYRQIFLQTYPQFLGKNYAEIHSSITIPGETELDRKKDNFDTKELELLHDKIDHLSSEVNRQNQTISEISQIINKLTRFLTSIEQNERIDSHNIEVLKRRIENLPYEMNDPACSEKYVLPHIMSLEETIQAIVHDHKSIARFGDGEFGLMYGDARWRFQQKNEKLAQRLRQVVTSDEPNILIGLNNFYGDLSHQSPHDADGIRSYITPAIRAQHMQLLSTRRVYANACISRTASWEMVRLQKTIWEKKDCIFIEGKQTRMGIGNDLFDNARSIQRILCPAENAFDRYEDILNEARKLPADKTILIALGPTASVLAYDLALMGYHAIDIGHADLSYEWLIRNNGTKTAVTSKYNNEYPDGYIVEDIHDPVYDSQIIADVS